MKLKTVAMISALGMISSSAAAYVMTNGRQTAETVASGWVAAATATTAAVAPPPGARFVAGKTVRIDGRLGHASLAADGRRETFVMLEMTGANATTEARAPLDIALVIDRSGSMTGGRIDNAISAAVGLVEGLSDGDVVSAISFDTSTTLVVPATPVDAGSRPGIVAALRGIQLGGDTCISCGVDRASKELAVHSGQVDRMIVLSDGRANHGVLDPQGLARIAEQARESDIAITTVGLGFDYNELTLSRLASSSNGAHYFVPDATALDTVFQAEAAAVAATVASEAMAEVELAPGVELLEVVDRAHRREGDKIVVPLGAFSAGGLKTVLMRVRLPPEGAAGDHAPVATTRVRFRDLAQASGEPASEEGQLAVPLTSEPDAEPDVLVNWRLQRRRTRDVLKEANSSFKGGRMSEAERMLKNNLQRLERARWGVRISGDARARDIDDDFAKQQADTQKSLDGLQRAKREKGKRRRGFQLDNVQMMNPYSL
jgi:Ca-activated chloride channel homolog